QARAEEVKRHAQTRAALDSLTSFLIEGNLLAKQSALTEKHKEFLRGTLRAYEEFAADTGPDEASRWGVARAYLMVGQIRMSLDPSPDAVDAYYQAATRLAQLAADFPTVPRYRGALGKSYVNLGIILQRTGRFKEAEAASRDGIALLEPLAIECPD